MDYLWIYLGSIGLLISTAFLPSGIYLLAKTVLTPMKLWPWEEIVIWNETKTRVTLIQRKDLWFSKKS